MSTTALAMREIAHENRVFWRNPAAAFFTFAFPLLFLFIFNTVFGTEQSNYSGFVLNLSYFYVPSIAVFSIIQSCYTAIGIGTTFARDAGTLKRVRGTPLPPWIFIFGRVTHLILVALLLTIIVTVAGWLFYDVDIPTGELGRIALVIAVAAPSFCALGLAVTAVIPNADAAPPIVNFTVLPVLFISDVFFGPDASPDWLQRVANIFPVRPFVQLMLPLYAPEGVPLEFQWGDLLVVGAWGLAGALLALKYFSWEPRV